MLSLMSLVLASKQEQEVPMKNNSSSFKAETVYSKVDRIDKSSFCFQGFTNRKCSVSVCFGGLVLVTEVWIRNHKNAVTQLLR